MLTDLSLHIKETKYFFENCQSQTFAFRLVRSHMNPCLWNALYFESHTLCAVQSCDDYINNKKILLRDCKRRTVRDVACLLGGRSILLSCPGGYPCPVQGYSSPTDLTGVPPHERTRDQRPGGTPRKGPGIKDQEPEIRGYPPPVNRQTN